MDETGLIADEDEVEEAYVGYLGEDEDGTCVYLTDTVKVTQADVRKLQLAKASIAAGIRILLSEREYFGDRCGAGDPLPAVWKLSEQKRVRQQSG